MLGTLSSTIVQPTVSKRVMKGRGVREEKCLLQAGKGEDGRATRDISGGTYQLGKGVVYHMTENQS